MYTVYYRAPVASFWPMDQVVSQCCAIKQTLSLLVVYNIDNTEGLF